MRKEKKIKLTIWLKPNIKEWLQKEADKRGLSLGSYIALTATGEIRPNVYKEAPPKTLDDKLRGTPMQIRFTWKVVKEMFHRMLYEECGESQEKFDEMYGDLYEEAERLIEAHAVDKFIEFQGHLPWVRKERKAMLMEMTKPTDAIRDSLARVSDPLDASLRNVFKVAGEGQELK